jgi:beta-lactamase regulating signal transducer with metallopeptidase domain
MNNSNALSILVTQTWQIALLAIVVWGVTRMLAKNRPHLAHALWLLVLIKTLTPPIWSSPTSPFSWIATTSNTQQAASHEQLLESTAAMAKSRQMDRAARLGKSETPIGPHLVEPDSVSVDLQKPESGVSAVSRPKGESGSTANKSTFGWQRVVFWLWCGGALLGLAMLVVRYSLFLRWMRTTTELKSTEVADLAIQLSRQLGLRCRVRVRILESPVGPVVLGLFRPTVVLPAAIVRGKPASELAPLLAHELIHFRRGDLWWALIQVLSKNLFWFHPLVHFAARQVTREAERSCDEETIASLGCTPAAYARCLLGVLEQKHQLRVAPALPGVRPVEITSARLERVMKLGNGIHRKTPVWTWLVLLLGCVFTLPGAAMVWAQNQTAAPRPIEVVINDQSGKNDQIVAFQISIVELSQSDIDKLDIKWKLKKPDIDELKELDSAAIPHATTEVEREIPTLIGLLDADQYKSVKEKVDALGAQVTAARVTTLVGLTGIVRRGANSFAQVNGEADMRPVGAIAKFTPTRVDADGIRFDCDIQFIEKTKGRLPNQNEKVLEDTPWMSRTRIKTTLSAKHDQAIAIRALHESDAGELNPVILLIKPWESKQVHRDNADLSKPLVPTPVDDGETITVKTHFFKLEPSAVKDLGIEWSTYIAWNPDQSFLHYLDDEQMIGALGNIPTKYAILDKPQREGLFSKAKSNPNITITNAPTITLFDRRTTELFDGFERPFVVDVAMMSNQPAENGKPGKVMQPKVEVFKEGLLLELTPTLLDEGNLRLNSGFRFSKVVSVAIIDAPSDKSDVPVKAQKPVINHQNVSSSIEFPRDKALVMLVPDLDLQPVLVIVECKSAADKYNDKFEVTRTPKCFTFTGNDSDEPNIRIMDAIHVHSPVKDITISKGAQKSFRFGIDTPEIAVENPDLVKIEFVGARDAEIKGLKVGKTACTIKTSDGSLVSFEIEVVESPQTENDGEISPRVSISAKAGVGRNIQFQHEIDTIVVVSGRSRVEITENSAFRVSLKPLQPGNSIVEVVQKDGKTLQLALSISGYKFEGSLLGCGGDDRGDTSSLRTVEFQNQKISLTESVVIEQKDGATVLSGNELVLVDDDRVVATADQGELVFTKEGRDYSLKLNGNAMLMLSEGSIWEADEIRQGFNKDGKLSFELTGNARITNIEPVFRTSSNNVATADRIWSDGAVVKFKGNARVTQKRQSGEDQTYEGNEIHMENGEVKVIESP